MRQVSSLLLPLLSLLLLPPKIAQHKENYITILIENNDSITY